jgi:hypothetical protein
VPDDPVSIATSTNDEDQGLTDELQREEKEDNGGEWGLNFGTSEERTEFTDEWSEEEKQLHLEEKAEEDDW